jgi:predicted RNase H-like HicB family nuclease
VRTAEIINVRIGRNPDGWYVATSDDLPGLYVAHSDIDEVIADIPDTIKALYEADQGMSVNVMEASYRHQAAEGMLWITLPQGAMNPQASS